MTLISTIILGLAAKDIAITGVGFLILIGGHIIVSNKKGGLNRVNFRSYFFRHWVLQNAYDVGYFRGMMLRWLGRVYVPIGDVKPQLSEKN